jgi:hypothetical protein
MLHFTLTSKIYTETIIAQSHKKFSKLLLGECPYIFFWIA